MHAKRVMPRSNYRAWELLYQLVLGTVLLLIAAIMLIPLLYVLAVSFTDPSVYKSGKLILWPEKWSLSAYRLVLSGNGFGNALQASLFITLVGTSLSMFVSSTFAYMLSKPELPGRRVILALVLFTMLFSPGLIPHYLLVRSLGLLNSWWALILPVVTNAWTLLVLKSFFQTLPRELEEAAKIDGANDIYIFFRIIVPLSKAPLAAIALFFAVGYWNTYFTAVIYLTDATKWPLQVMLQQVVMASNISRFTSSEVSAQLQLMQRIPSETIKMATVVIVTLPILVVYPFLQKYFAKGVMLGSIKQ